jgi:prepilin-type N-terminal cleavage/methylation domain-containing protein
MKGFTLTELIVVVAIMGVAAMLGTRYYYSDIDMYRFQNALTEFKSAVNLARARSLTGVTTDSAGTKRVNKPLSINISSIIINGSNIITLNPTANQDLSVVTNGSYITLSGFCPDDESQAKLLAAGVLFPYWINGPLWKVTSSDESLTPTVDVILNVPAFGNSITITLNPLTAKELEDTSIVPTVPTAYMHVKPALKIIIEEDSGIQAYATTYESGPSIEFKYNNKNNIQVTFTPTPVSPEIGTIVFDKGLTAQGKTYQVTFTRVLSGVKVDYTYTVLPTGILTQP